MSSASPPQGDLSPEYLFLGLLEQGASYGYELHERVRVDLRHIWRVSLSQTYGILKRLEMRGEIQGKVEPQEKRPDRRRFQLTPMGRRRFEAWLTSPVGPSVRALRMAFTTKLYFARRRGDSFMRTLLDAQETSLQSGLDQLRDALQAIPSARIFSRLSVQMRITQLEASQAWLQMCRQELLGHPLS